MRKINLFQGRYRLIPAFCAALLLLFSGCSDKATNVEPVQDIEQVTLGTDLLAKLQTLSNLHVEGEFTDVMNKGGFSFANPGSGTSFTDPATGITYSQPSNGVIVGAASFGSGGGTLSVDGKNITLDHVLCLTASDESEFGDLLNADGFSLLLGISGNFDLMNDSADIEDMDIKIVYFFVFDSEASGSYNVFNLEEEEDLDDAQDMAFALVFDYNAHTFYFSASGFLNVAGGSISYAGQMFKFDTNIMESNSDVIARPKKVAASGTLSCNG